MGHNRLIRTHDESQAEDEELTILLAAWGDWRECVDFAGSSLLTRPESITLKPSRTGLFSWGHGGPENQEICDG